MAIIVNSTTNIPTTDDFVISNNIPLDKVEAKYPEVGITDYVIVWEKQKGPVTIFEPDQPVSLPYTIKILPGLIQHCTRGDHDDYITHVGDVKFLEDEIQFVSAHELSNYAFHAQEYKFRIYLIFNAIDLTPFKTLAVKYKMYSFVSTDNEHHISLQTNILDASNDELYIKKSEEFTGTGYRKLTDGDISEPFEKEGTLKLDISSLSGEYRITIENGVESHTSYNSDYGGHGAGYIHIYSIKLES